MSGFELNKIIAAVLLASLVAMIVGIVANVLYKPNLMPAQRGYSIAVEEGAGSDKNASIVEVVVDIAELMKSANAASGQEVAKKCLSCHSLDKGGPNRVGPNLWDVAGRDKATEAGYKYSAAMQAKGGAWDDESLFHFLNKPSKFIPGTKMSFAGLSKPTDIVNIIAFLKTFAQDKP
ncbi:c-type cytochrome [Candidatus Trichorickettsia mobilis]|uniref:c-type cytochrome n=1 Tax=Candidatus Trichorickettsia mobilis TaxID=1346319 RepID=UPI002930EE6C|nr:cytochrome c family protein [Candidatus Trichorickettsia mobilis]